MAKLENVSIKVRDVGEVKKVLKKLESMGFKWRSDDELFCECMVKWFASMNYIDVSKNKIVTWSETRPMYSSNVISAKEFLKEKETIVIYRNGTETVALDKSTGKKAVAKCSPADEYDFYFGANVALGRLLIGVTEPEFKPHLLYRMHNYGYIGEKTPLKDAIGRELRIGDTVEVYESDNTFRGECVIVKTGGKAFVCGIEYNCKENGEITGGWKIILKRKCEDIADGEEVDDIKYIKEV